MPKPYRLIAFDCVNTLYLPDASRIPMVELDGKQVPTTAGLLHERLAPLLPDLALHQAHLALRNAWRWAEAQRGPELLEVPARRRFRRFFFELGLREPEERLLDELLELHMRAVTGSFILPAAHRQVLTRLRRSHRLALFSNFDHAPSMQRLLRESGISDWFDPLIISDALGYRKPGRAAFSRAIGLIGEAPQDILFVGDSLEDDVQGARQAGIDVAWINAKGLPAPANFPPTYELRELPALIDLLAE